MPDLYFATTHAGAQQIAYVIANLHQLPKRGTHVGQGPHVDMPEKYIQGRDHIGWSVRPYANVRRLHPTQDQWGTLYRTDSQALWDDVPTREARLGVGQIESFSGLLPTAKALDAAWTAGTPIAERHNVGEARIENFGGDPSGIGNSTAAFQAAIASAGSGGKITGAPGTYKINAESIIPLPGQNITGPMTFVAASAGDWLLYTNNVCYADCTWDGANLVQDCIVADSSSLNFSGRVTRAVRYGLHISLGLCTLKMQADSCGSHGVYLFGANATRIESLRSINNGGYGFEAVGSFDPVLKAQFPTLTAGGIFVDSAVLELNALGPFRLNGVEGGKYNNLRSEGGGISEIRLSHGLVVDYHSRAGASLNLDDAFVVLDQSIGIELRALYNNPGVGPQTFPRVELRGNCHGLDPASSIRYWSGVAMAKLPIVQEHLGTCNTTNESGAVNSPSLTQTFPAGGAAISAADVGRRFVAPAAGIDTTIGAYATPGGIPTITLAGGATANATLTGTGFRIYRPWSAY